MVTIYQPNSTISTTRLSRLVKAVVVPEPPEAPEKRTEVKQRTDTKLPPVDPPKGDAAYDKNQTNPKMGRHLDFTA